MGKTETTTGIGRAWQRKGTVYILGIDGLTLDIIRPMIARGELPNFARLAADGSHGPLKTISPTDSPIVWTTIATGRHFRDHGVDGFHKARIFGREKGHSFVRKARKYGLKYPLRWMERLGWMKRALYDARDVRCKPFWDLACEAGMRVGVVNWWDSWPAAPVEGFMVSDRFHFWRAAARGETAPDAWLTWPAKLAEELKGLAIRPDDVTAEDVKAFVNLPESELAEFAHAKFSHHELRGELRFLISSDRTHEAVFHKSVSAQPVDIAAVYLRAPDIAQHCAFHYMPEAARSKATQEERRKFGGVVPAAYRFSDAIVGRALARMKPEDSIFVLSDHGYGWQESRGNYGHARGEPPGVIYAMGPDFARGKAVANAGVYDFLPTLLRLIGLPASRELNGKCLEAVFRKEFLASHPAPEPVNAYGPRKVEWDKLSSSASVEKDMTEHLKALGYMD